MRLNVHGNHPILAPRDPELPMEVATKNYVDVNLDSHASNLGLHLTSSEKNLVSKITASPSNINHLNGVIGNVQAQINDRLLTSGGTLTGPILLYKEDITIDPDGEPFPPRVLDEQEAVPKVYVDEADALKLDLVGGVLTGALSLHDVPTSVMHAATKGYVDSELLVHSSNKDIHVTAAQNTLLDGLTVTHTEINQLTGISGNVQNLIDDRLKLTGGVVSGSITLNAAPTVTGHLTNKKYVDDQSALQVNKSGSTMTGALILSGAPTTDLQASTKKYVDDTVTTHKADFNLHLTPTQNTWIDSITSSAVEINHLVGVTGGVQTQLNTKFDKVGGTVTGDITLAAGKTVFVSKVPAADTELVNKAYVDSRIKGLEWKDPVTDINLVGDKLTAPPSSPVIGDVYIAGVGATGAWAGKAGYAFQFKDEGWVALQNRAVAVGDRFGVGFTTATTLTGGCVGKKNSIFTVKSAVVGAITYTEETHTSGSTTLVFDPDSKHFGVSYSLTDEGVWVATNTSTNLTPGEGMSLTGNLLNLKLGDGLLVSDDLIQPDLNRATGIDIVGKKIALKATNSTITLSTNGIAVSAGVVADISDRVSKTIASNVTSLITVKAGGGLKVEVTPTTTTDVTNKAYVDGLNTTLAGRVTTLESNVSGLLTDPVTKDYVTSQVNLQVSKSGDTMSGLLTLSANPTAALHAAPKQYVDSQVNTHANNATLHITAAQNTLLDALTVSSAEVNHLVGVTSSVQTQLNSKVNKAGDTLTGFLTTHANPTANLHVANKAYVDTGLAAQVAKAGDTMTGALTLFGNPTGNLHAATKQYVDSGITSHESNNTLHITALERTWLTTITATAAEVNYVKGVTSPVQTQLNSKLNLSGGAMTGLLTLSGVPTVTNHAATKGYVDSGLATQVAKAGDTMTGALLLNANPVAALGAATKQYVDTKATEANTYTNQAVAPKLNLSGGTLTGPLLLNANPTIDLGAATKGYVDSSISSVEGNLAQNTTLVEGRVTTLEGKVNTLNLDPVTKAYVGAQDNLKLDKTGGSLTGPLTLQANPTQNLHAATKQYVDAIAQGLAVKPAIRLGTTTNLAANYTNGSFGVNSTLTGTANGVLTLDGEPATLGDRILVKNQTAKLQNGDYTVQQVGSSTTPFILKRVITADESNEIPGSYFHIFGGTSLKGTGWVFVVDNPITFKIGVDPIHVNQFSGQGTIEAGDGLSIDGNTISIQTASPTRIKVNAANIDLATTGVSPGTFKSLTVDGYGRVTAGTNPNTLQGFGITDGQPLSTNLTSIAAISTTGVIVRSGAGNVVSKEITATGVGIAVTNGNGVGAGNITVTSNATSAATVNTIVSRDASNNFSAGTITAALNGNAKTATTLATARNVSIGGDVTAPAISFNGAGNVALVTTLKNSGVTAGSYRTVTVDIKGRVTGGSNPTTLAASGITDGVTIASLQQEVKNLRDEMNELYSYVMSRT